MATVKPGDVGAPTSPGRVSLSITLNAASQAESSIVLKKLEIVNFVLIPHLIVEFHRGLNLLTGETGSGKSIIVDALNTLLGGRKSTDVIREGARSAVVEGTFELTKEARKGLIGIMEQNEIDVEDVGEVFVRREINAHGRHRVFVNESQVTTATLKQMQVYLLEIHGQFEQQHLLGAVAQVEMLDKFADCLDLRDEVEILYGKCAQLLAESRKLAQDLAESEQKSDLWRYQLQEIERINPQPCEDQELLRERPLLAQAEKLMRLSSEAYADLYEKDASLLAVLAIVRRRVEELAAIDSRLATLVAELAEATVLLADAAETMRNYGDKIEYSPERLQTIDHRLAELDRVKRKYNADLERLAIFRAELKNNLANLDDHGEREERLKSETRAARDVYIRAAAKLSACRRRAAPRLEQQLMRELGQVAMEGARFAVRIETAAVPSEGMAAADDHAFFTPRGADRIEFELAANPGETLRPLARVASGGELSRLMLTLRLVGAEAAKAVGAAGRQETLIFDEIDAGIGGQAAEAVGRRLKKLAQQQQVLCVTHQPQIARFADHHYFVVKSVAQGRTVTNVTELNTEQRIGELARMIGGAEELSTREAARWLLESAKATEGHAGKTPKRKGKSVNAAARNESS